MAEDLNKETEPETDFNIFFEYLHSGLEISKIVQDKWMLDENIT